MSTRALKRNRKLTQLQPAAYSSHLLTIFRDAIRRCPTISMHDEIMNGEPCIAGTRIPVRRVLRAMEQYGSIEGATKYYPDLSKEQVKDALYFSQIVLELPGGVEETEIVD